MADAKKFEKVRGVTRLKYKTTGEGWWARYTRDGVTFGQTFYDSEYGTPEAGLEAAKKWHKEAREILPPINRKQYAEIKKSNNTSGHTGVCRTFSRRVGGKRYMWVAHWSPEKGKFKHKYFYIDEHGEEEAKRLAIEARKAGLAEVEKDWPEEYWEYRRRQDELDNMYFFDPFAYEGGEKYDIHKRAERSREIRNKKIEQFLETYGELYCEVCGFNFEKEYGEIGKGLIEVHHTVPLSEMKEGHKTTLDELICICSNCHFAVHNGDHKENLRRLRFIFDAKNKKSNKSG